VISDSEVVITNQMMDNKNDYRIRLAVILDVLMPVAFIAVIGIMAVKVR
jgi:hypothetical protein